MIVRDEKVSDCFAACLTQVDKEQEQQTTIETLMRHHELALNVLDDCL
jgi:Mg/Co/Ni transporter MgtE